MKDIEILVTKAQTFLRTAERTMSDGDYDSCVSRCYYAHDTRLVGDYGVTASVAQDEAEDLLDAAQDFVRKVKSYLDQWMEKEAEK